MKLVVFLLIVAVSACATTGLGQGDSKLEKVLEKYKGDVLYPDDVNKIDWSSLPMGFKFAHKLTWFDGEQSVTEYILHKVEGNEYHVYKVSLPEQKKEEGIFYENGESFYRSKNFPKQVWKGFEGCSLFKLGSCTYKYGAGTRSLEIEFSNGIWTYKTRTTGLTYKTVRRVYDKYGILLYSSENQVNKAQSINQTLYYERVQ